jgi:hypothetical protein
MNGMTRGKGVFRGMGWLLGSAIVLLFLSAGLTLWGKRAMGHTSMANVLLLFYFASWSYVVGLLGLVLPPVWWLLFGMTRHAMRRTPAEGDHRRLEELELYAHQFIERSVPRDVPSRSPSSGREEKETNSLTRVA